jgi:Zn finger protein HypA/HybF involved in hydrogenase expression
LKKHRKEENSVPAEDEDEKFYCSVCGHEISEEEYESYDGMCWECWDDQLTEESDDMFGDLM